MPVEYTGAERANGTHTQHFFPNNSYEFHPVDLDEFGNFGEGALGLLDAAAIRPGE